MQFLQYKLNYSSVFAQNKIVALWLVNAVAYKCFSGLLLLILLLCQELSFIINIIFTPNYIDLKNLPDLWTWQLLQQLCMYVCMCKNIVTLLMIHPGAHN